MQEQITRFLNYMRVGRSASDQTLRAYRSDLQDFLCFLQENCGCQGEIFEESIVYFTATNVRKYISWMLNHQYHRSSIGRKVSAIKSFARFLCRERLIENNPMEEISVPKREKKLPRFLYPKEVVALLEQPDITTPKGMRDRAWMELLYASGIRISELTKLNIGDLSLDSGQFYVKGKGEKERIAFFGEEAKAALSRYIQQGRRRISPEIHDDKAVFLSTRGNRMSDRDARRILNRYVDQLATLQHVNPHMFRHTFATHMLNGGADLRSVQELLGHSNLSTTQIYTHLTRETLKKIHQDTFPRQ